MEGIQEDYVTLAIWALSRSFVNPEELVHKEDSDDESDADVKSASNSNNGNDPYFQRELANASSKSHSMKSPKPVAYFTEEITIPTLQQMNDEILYHSNPHGNGASNSSWYKYDDQHYSNKHRFYKCDGLDNSPLQLPQIIIKGLESMNGKSRQQGEEIMMKDRMFKDFMDAVKAKGFFDITDKDVKNYIASTSADAETIPSPSGESTSLSRKEVYAVKDKIYEERYRKVVSKFRLKLVENGLEEEYETKDSDKENMQAQPDTPSNDTVGTFDDEITVSGSVVGAIEKARENGTLHLDDDESISRKVRASSSGLSQRRISMAAKASRKDIEEAEKMKLAGNALMQKKKYQEAKDYYTKALEITPSGPTSHVYYSNRAAALLSMRNFTEAVWDAERSVALKPDYPKAYARLGLAHFLLGQYKEAVEAYTMAVKYEPGNETSVSYLDRSKKKLSLMNDDDGSVNSRRSSKSERRMSRSRNGSRRSSAAVSKSDRSKGKSRREGRGEEELDDERNLETASAAGTNDEKLDEANRLKVDGNKAMARKEYEEAIKLYSMALRLAPAGPQSHVFFSNRAAALCYLERYEEAELDAERALALDPEFGKAHARLGLARYFLRDYDGAVEAYESAADHDPDNESNRIYLAKAKLKLGRRQSMAKRTME